VSRSALASPSAKSASAKGDASVSDSSTSHASLKYLRAASSAAPANGCSSSVGAVKALSSGSRRLEMRAAKNPAVSCICGHKRTTSLASSQSASSCAFKKNRTTSSFSTGKSEHVE